MPNHIEVDPETHALLTRLAETKHLTLSETLTRAALALHRAELVEQLNAGYALHEQENATPIIRFT